MLVTALEESDVVTDDLCGVPISAVLVLPLARLQSSLDVDLLTLLAVLGDIVRCLAETYDVVPLSVITPVSAVPVLASICGCKPQLTNVVACFSLLDFWVLPQIPNEDYLVDHVVSFVTQTAYRVLRRAQGLSPPDDKIICLR